MSFFLAAAGIAEYLQSEKRPSNFWGSDWLQKRSGKGWGQQTKDTLSVVKTPVLLAVLTLAVALAKK